jgi:DNA-binding transcriptional regulator YhcF (GntR family)
MTGKIGNVEFFKNFKKVDKHIGMPAYLQIVNQIKAKIMVGILKDGTRLPPVRELEQIFDVNVNTILKALEKLKSEGLVQSEQGVGYFISAGVSIGEGIISIVRNLVCELKKKGIDIYTTLPLVEEVWKNECDE